MIFNINSTRGEMRFLTCVARVTCLVSVISHIAKIIEREIKHQMCIYLERNALITVDQLAYREGHNTQTALHKVLDDWYYNIADGLHS